MRKSYLDNIRWVTVVLVVFFHVLYMYNGEGIAGTLGKITSLEVQYYDVYMYIVFPWFMAILFIVSGISSKLYLDKHTDKEFIGSRTTKLLVPCTIGLVAFQFIQGYINMSFGDAGSMDIPAVIKYLIMLASGIGVLWYIQVLWLFSMILVLIRKIEKNRLLNIGKKTNLPTLILLSLAFYGAGQILNTPIICVYRFGLYFTAFIMGYFVFSHDEVIDILKKWFVLFCPVAIALGVAFCIKYFGQNYADKPVNKSPLFLFYSYFACLAMLGGFARFFDLETEFTKWMSTHSFGLYVFHYLGISSVALFLARNGLISPLTAYVLSLIAGFVFGYGLYAIISRIPFFRWAVLGIRGKR
ncbi:acyltransferase family protein [Butyrivibrio sp. M55]|uniref:acyltransferase family protein n=1 Tax=Butyrivibrio sp. M55 TaxID=1855323 RepID=UPI0008E55912|nr:acyltransferase [Butyrivibrio sp. M55]SFU43975.1 Acyltransferase family protein [Butyrivibrio sp. M55]